MKRLLASLPGPGRIALHDPRRRQRRHNVPAEQLMFPPGASTVLQAARHVGFASGRPFGPLGTLPAVVLVLLLAGCTPSAPTASASPSVTIQPTGTSATSATSSPSASPIDTTDWVVYESKQYGFSLKHPPGWRVVPAIRDWTLEADGGQLDTPGQETFKAPGGHLYVGVWSTPVKDTPETLEGVAAWVENLCQEAYDDCSGLDRSRSEALCNGTDCDPGLLVTSDSGYVEAFFTGGKHKGQMVSVVVGRSERHPTVWKYGGARRLLEAFLATMDVCPARPNQQGCP